MKEREREERERETYIPFLLQKTSDVEQLAGSVESSEDVYFGRFP